MPSPIPRTLEPLIETLSRTHKRRDEEQTITVNEAIGALAFYYEKIRTVIEYQDEHLLRQNAIRRILGRRRLLNSDPKELADALLRELIRSRYLPNSTLPQRVIGEVTTILSFYFSVMEILKQRKKMRSKDYDILLALASCAIDEHLAPLISEEALVSLMYATVESLANTPSGVASDALRKNQLSIATYRVLLRPDIMRLRYYLLKQTAAFWKDGSGDAGTASQEYIRIMPNIDGAIRHPLNRRFLAILRRYRLPFVALHAVLKRDLSLASDPKKLEKEIASFCVGLYASQKKRLRSRTIHAFLYILLTKMLLGFAVEIPYDKYVLHELKKLPLFINALFPPALLAFLILTVRFPTSSNTDLIVQGIREILEPNRQREVFVFKNDVRRRKNPILSFFFQLLYVVLFGLSFGLLVWALEELEFSLVSGGIFFIFFSLIMFFGMSLRRSIQELTIRPLKTNFLISFLDQFFLPVLAVGRWLTFNIPRINVLVFLFDIIIETPFQALIEITEEWFAFLKEKKEEME